MKFVVLSRLGLVLGSGLAALAVGTARATPADDGVAWSYAASDAEVDAAVVRARRESKPVFVYWGAKWCPPCNQLQATLFNRQDFIERSRAFIAVYVHDDQPGAQKLGTRFAVEDLVYYAIGALMTAGLDERCREIRQAG